MQFAKNLRMLTTIAIVCTFAHSNVATILILWFLIRLFTHKHTHICISLFYCSFYLFAFVSFNLSMPWLISPLHFHYIKTISSVLYYLCARQKQHYVNELALYCHCLNRSNRFKILLHWSIPSRCIIMCVRVVVRIIFCFDVFTIAPFWRVKCLATKTKLMKQKEKQCKKANNK